MALPRRNFVKSLIALGAFQRLDIATRFDEVNSQEVNSDFDRKSYDFWANFLDTTANPIMAPTTVTRGKLKSPGSGEQPVFIHYGPEGFRNAGELDPSELIPSGDVTVGLNTSTIKIAPQDLEKFERVQNAQVRVDVVQKEAILPVLEAMAYTLVSGMLSPKAAPKSRPTSSSSSSGKGAAAKSSSGAVQSIAPESDTDWQKMQNIILPGGEGRWALNLEGQKKDSTFYKIMQVLIKDVGQFAPFIGLTGIAISALQSFNLFYGAIHAKPVTIIKSNPLRIFATQDAIDKTGAPGAATGILLKSGTYFLAAASSIPSLDAFKDLTIMQGRVVPPKTDINALDTVAIDTLKDVTYVTFDVEVTPTRILSTASSKRTS